MGPCRVQFDEYRLVAHYTRGEQPAQDIGNGVWSYAYDTTSVTHLRIRVRSMGGLVRVRLSLSEDLHVPLVPVHEF